MKAGLVTFYHIHHYGALLQAAATERAVETLGGECEIVDYFVNQNNALFRKPTGLGSAAAVEAAVAAGKAEAEKRELYITHKVIARQSEEIEWFAHLSALGKDKLR